MLCKFYQQGNCRFGDNCRYVHEDYDQGDRHGYNKSYHGHNQSNYSSHSQSNYSGHEGSYYQGRRSHYHNAGHSFDNRENYRKSNQDSHHRQSFQSNVPSHNRYAPLEDGRGERRSQEVQEVTSEDHLREMQSDMKDWSNSSTMWRLSCYAPFKYSSCLPGFEEYSTDEMRFAYMKAGPEGRLPDYFNWLGSIVNTNTKAIEEFSHVYHQQKPHVINLIRNSLSDSKDSSDKKTDSFKSSSSGSFPNSAGNITVFGAINQGAQQQPVGIFQQQQQGNIFQQQGGIFQQQQVGVFQQQPQQNTFQQMNIFQQQQQPVDTSNPFNIQQQATSSPFQQQQQQFNAFYKPNQAAQNLVASSTFTSANNPPTVFGSSVAVDNKHSTFGGFSKSVNAFDRDPSSGDFYTSMETLTEEDSIEFNAELFSFVPIIPPPKELI